jgi:hypothetical protein
MKKLIFPLVFCLSCLFFTQTLTAQVGINEDGSSPDASAMLDVHSTTKGMLVPRMTSVQRTAIASPATGLLVFDSTTGTFWYYGGAAWIELTDTNDGDWVATGDHISNGNVGNVGIGTTNPATTLHVDGDGNKLLVGASGGVLSKLTVNAETGTEVARFRINGTTQAIINTDGDMGVGTPSPSAQLDVVGTSEFNGDMTIDGNVGIKTTTPAATLHVDGDGNKLLVGASGGVLSKLTVNAETGTEIARFRTNGTTKAIINADGEMGVGTPSPSAQLDVVGNTELNGELTVNNNSILNGNLTVDTEIFSVDATNDRVGVYTSTPDYTFEVEHLSGVPGASSGNGLTIKNKSGDGTAHWSLYNWSSGNFSLYQAGVLKGTFSEVDGNYTAASDRRLKNNIEPMEGGILGKVKLLNPVRYHFIGHEEQPKEYGLIAQEVQQLLPELTPVIQPATDGSQQELLGINYSEMVPVLIKAMQEQQALIEAQQAKIQELETGLERLNRLEAALQQLTGATLED